MASEKGSTINLSASYLKQGSFFYSSRDMMYSMPQMGDKVLIYLKVTKILS